MHLLEDFGQLIYCQLKVERHVGGVERALIECFAGLQEPEAIDLAD